ncbi:hypothetical protein B0H67DRAFT_489321 [Lasiosphaeris hirsuta]|uniref:Uncharacterized protein n=1 Tax=Lasiosphaeris hirsuta TaxID=260670 RepID=A0AA40AH33_9PEZI|nr:hypothetical protein B0H67DRAFT_489321 [Lasiosphaeris hirsuta]
MPVPVAAKAGIIVASVAVAAAIALYESPEFRRVAENLRRRIAITLHALGDNFDPSPVNRDPLFNRPEDAEGFLQSRGAAGVGADPDMVADDETRRRQREELMYWNAIRESKQLEEERSQRSQQALGHRPPSSRGSTFDDFLQEDKTTDRGTFVYNTGASVWASEQQQGVIRRRGPEGVRGLNASVIANPFSDEYGIELDDHPGMEIEEKHALSPGRDEIMSDIYNATVKDEDVITHTLSPQSKPVVPDMLFDFDTHSRTTESATADHETLKFETPAASETRSVTLERDLAEDEYMTAGQDDRDHESDRDAYASIQAWAQNSNPGFYSPLPVSPAAPLSEAEVISTGDLTPTYSASLAGSGEDVGNDAASSKDGDYDVLSDDGDGIATPNSWSEVGSVVSESEGAMHA